MDLTDVCESALTVDHVQYARAELCILSASHGMQLLVLVNHTAQEAVHCEVAVYTANTQMLTCFSEQPAETIWDSEHKIPLCTKRILRMAIPPNALRILAILQRATSGTNERGVPDGVGSKISDATADRLAGRRGSIAINMLSVVYKQERVVFDIPAAGSGIAAAPGRALLPPLFRCHPLSCH